MIGYFRGIVLTGRNNGSAGLWSNSEEPALLNVIVLHYSTCVL